MKDYERMRSGKRQTVKKTDNGGGSTWLEDTLIRRMGDEGCMSTSIYTVVL